MTSGPTPLRLEWVNTVEKVPPSQWDALVEPESVFSRHAFLWAFEKSGSVGPGTGWAPRYLLAYQGEVLVGAVFAYEKTHSYGEYIFDWAWAQAYDRAGLAYYPKAVAAVPMTPATGRRILLLPGVDEPSVTQHLAEELVRCAGSQGWSSVHVLFCREPEAIRLENVGFETRHTFQFHWRNHGYPSFQAFLTAVKARKRKQILRERQSVSTLPVQILTGASLTPRHAAAFYSFYLSTCEKKGAFAYLRPGFFESVFESMPEHTVLFLAGPPENPVAGSLCFRAGDHLYGRYWGCREEVPGLHFELCYYRPIEYAIEKTCVLFEAGAQGEHKVARGFLPEVTYSAHWIAHSGFRQGVSQFLRLERAGLAEGLAQFAGESPYKTVG